MTNDDQIMNEKAVQGASGLNFYNENRMDEIMEGNYQDEMLNDEGEDDLLMQQDIEDDMAAFIV